MDQEQLLALMEDWGRFHKQLLGLVFLPIALNGIQMMLVVVTLAVPLHRCRLPGVDNDTFQIQSDWHRQMIESVIPTTYATDGHPTYDKCRMYVNSSVYDVSNASHAYVNMTSVDEETVGCDSWVYDTSEFQSTVISQFDLVCEKKDFRAHINMMYILGLGIGSPLAGFLCDTFGRKPCLFAAVAGNFLVGILSAFSFDPLFFLVCRMLRGVVAMAIYLSIFVLVLEMVGPKRRNMVGSLTACLWTVGPFLTAAFSYVLPDWSDMQLLSAVPSFAFLLCWRFIPESPRWLLSKGRVGEAVSIVTAAARVNRTPVLPRVGEISEVKGDCHKGTPSHKVTPIQGTRQMIRYPRLVVRTLVIFCNWFAVATTYFGLSLNVANLGGNVRVNFLVSTAVELVGYCTAWALLDRWGRKKTHGCNMMLAGLSCLATIFSGLFLASEYGWVTTTLAMMGKLGISAAFASIYLLSAELFPTVIRNFAMGSSSTMGRVGGMLSPYIADLALHVEGSFGRVLPLVIFGSLAVAAGLLTFLLPETLGHQLPDTAEEAAHFGKKMRKKIAEGTEMATVDDGKQEKTLMEKNDA